MKILGSLVLLAGLFYISDFVIALFVAVVVASSIEIPVKMLVRVGVPRPLSVTMLFLLLAIILVSIAFIFIPPLADDFARFVKTLPHILDSITIFGKDMGFKDL